MKISDFEIEEPWQDVPLLTRPHKVLALLKKGYVLKVDKKYRGKRNTNQYYAPGLHKLEQRGNTEVFPKHEPDYIVPIADIQQYFDHPKTRSYNEPDGMYVYWHDYNFADAPFPEGEEDWYEI